MRSETMQWMDLATAAINRGSRSTRAIEVFTVSVFLAVLATVSFAYGLSLFEPDSWAYYELSSTFLHGNVYQFNTQRSYFSSQYSAAFPLGYPLILASARLFAGHSPLVAVGVNLVVAALSWFVIRRVALTLGLSRVAAYSLAFALLLWPWYLREMMSGCAIPAAMLLFLLGVWAYLEDRLLACGLALGLAAITRFDYLVFGVLFLLGSLVLDAGRRHRVPRAAFGFLVGISPWVAYSLAHFGKVWITDNAWVALAARPSFNLDYPAAASATAMNDFGGWLSRIIENVVPIGKSIAVGAVLMPVFLVACVFFISHWRSMPPALRARVGRFLLLVLLASVPYLLTGYADYRYFSLALLMAAAALLLAAESATPESGGRRAYVAALAGSVVLGAGIALAVVAFWVARQASGHPAPANMEQIRFLQGCHAQTPQAVYLFPRNLDAMGAQYGALTGNRTALMPSNLDRMSQFERDRYFEAMRPYVLADVSLQHKECGRPQ